MKKLLKWFAPGVVAASLFFFASQSVAAPSIAVYTFKAVCEDCSLEAERPVPVSATLTLQNYTPGTPLTGASSVLFSYSGSNLFSPFVISSNSSHFSLGSGSGFPAVVGAPGVSLKFEISGDVDNFVDLDSGDESTQSIYFKSLADGRWGLGFTNTCGEEGCSPADYGYLNTYFHTYSLLSFDEATNTNQIPEPGSMLLMGAALVAAGVARRRRT